MQRVATGFRTYTLYRNKLQPLKCGLDKVFDAGRGIFFEDGREDFVDVGLGKAEHDQSGRCFIDERAGIDLENGSGIRASAFDNLVF